MAGGKTDIEAANPPADLEPDGATISKISKPDKHCLGLGELLDGVEGEYSSRESDGVPHT